MSSKLIDKKIKDLFVPHKEYMPMEGEWQLNFIDPQGRKSNWWKQTASLYSAAMLPAEGRKGQIQLVFNNRKDLLEVADKFLGLSEQDLNNSDRFPWVTVTHEEADDVTSDKYSENVIKYESQPKNRIEEMKAFQKYFHKYGEMESTLNALFDECVKELESAEADKDVLDKIVTSYKLKMVKIMYSYEVDKERKAYLKKKLAQSTKDEIDRLANQAIEDIDECDSPGECRVICENAKEDMQYESMNESAKSKEISKTVSRSFTDPEIVALKNTFAKYPEIKSKLEEYYKEFEAEYEEETDEDERKDIVRFHKCRLVQEIYSYQLQQKLKEVESSDVSSDIKKDVKEMIEDAISRIESCDEADECEDLLIDTLVDVNEMLGIEEDDDDGDDEMKDSKEKVKKVDDKKPLTFNFKDGMKVEVTDYAGKEFKDVEKEVLKARHEYLRNNKK